jgi:hypothetical protein
MHGGLSTGPKTQEGKDRIRAAHLTYGEETLETKAERNEKSVMFRYLTDIGNRCNIFYKQLKTRGQPPSGYAKLDLSDRDQLALAILKTLPSKKPSITMWNAMYVQVRIMNVSYGL